MGESDEFFVNEGVRAATDRILGVECSSAERKNLAVPKTLTEDEIRELGKVHDFIKEVERYFHHQTLMNAALHCSEPRRSPLAAKAAIAADGLSDLLDRVTPR